MLLLETLSKRQKNVDKTKMATSLPYKYPFRSGRGILLYINPYTHEMYDFISSILNDSPIGSHSTGLEAGKYTERGT
jgi:hypothetical protein